MSLLPLSHVLLSLFCPFHCLKDNSKAHVMYKLMHVHLLWDGADIDSVICLASLLFQHRWSFIRLEFDDRHLIFPACSILERSHEFYFFHTWIHWMCKTAIISSACYRCVWSEEKASKQCNRKKDSSTKYTRSNNCYWRFTRSHLNLIKYDFLYRSCSKDIHNAIIWYVIMRTFIHILWCSRRACSWEFSVVIVLFFVGCFPLSCFLPFDSHTNTHTATQLIPAKKII